MPNRSTEPAEGASQDRAPRGAGGGRQPRQLIAVAAGAQAEAPDPIDVRFVQEVEAEGSARLDQPPGVVLPGDADEDARIRHTGERGAEQIDPAPLRRHLQPRAGGMLERRGGGSIEAGRAAGRDKATRTMNRDGSYGSMCCKCLKGAGGLVYVCRACNADHCSDCARVAVRVGDKVRLSARCHQCGGTDVRAQMRVY